MAKRIIGYTRVSTGRQVEEGLSLDAQKAKLEAYCALYDLELVEVFVDAGKSGKSMDRPELQRALAVLADGTVDGLLVIKLDRLTRSVRDLGELVERSSKQGWALMSVGEQLDTSSAGGRLVMNILCVVSQWEREIIAERVSSGMKHKASLGGYVGGKHTRYGTRPAGKGTKVVVESESERELIAEAVRLRRAGATLQAVADELAARGMLARTGKPLLPMQVARIVARAA